MENLNLLTRRMFAEGWTKDNHPNFVSDWTYCNEFQGGFEYTIEKRNRMVFSTPCGLLVKGSHWNSGYMSYMGIDWTLENDNPTINCPYRKQGCKKNHPLLRDHATDGGLCKMVFCACREVAAPYWYEQSLDKALDERAQRKEELFQEFAKSKRRICRYHCYFDENTETWTQHYNPMNCAGNHAGCQYCTILGKELDTRKGNVFYDLKITRKPETMTLFTKEYEVSIHKDKRLLEHNVSLDICEAIMKICPDEAQRKAESKFSRELFFSEHHGKYFKVEAINLRAERRVSRDLMQDLADVQAGYTVTHEADVLSAVKQQKSERKEKARQARIRKAKKLILQYGLDGIPASDLYRVRKMIDKGLISKEDISLLERRHKVEQGMEQLTFFMQEDSYAHT